MIKKNIKNYASKFTSIYEKEVEVAPIPKDKVVTVFFKDKDCEYYIPDVMSEELGLEKLIAKKWILQSELDLLMKT